MRYCDILHALATPKNENHIHHNSNCYYSLEAPTPSPRFLRPRAMHLRSPLFDGIPAFSAFAAPRRYIFAVIFMLLSGGLLEMRGWAATKLAWADPSAASHKLPALSALCPATVDCNDWLHAKLFSEPILQVINAVVGLCAILRPHCASVAAASKLLRRSFCWLTGLAIATKLR